jgi:hypothetical protein
MISHVPLPPPELAAWRQASASGRSARAGIAATDLVILALAWTIERAGPGIPLPALPAGRPARSQTFAAAASEVPTGRRRPPRQPALRGRELPGNCLHQVAPGVHRSTRGWLPLLHELCALLRVDGHRVPPGCHVDWGSSHQEWNVKQSTNDLRRSSDICAAAPLSLPASGQGRSGSLPPFLIPAARAGLPVL